MGLGTSRRLSYNSSGTSGGHYYNNRLLLIHYSYAT